MTVRDLVLGVDLDGVCADYESGLRASVAARRGVDPSTLPPQETTGSFAEWGLTPEGFREAHRVAVVEDRIFRTLDPYPGVAEALWRLSDAGVWIRIITHRLLFNGLHEASAADTAFWLDQHDLPYRDPAQPGLLVLPYALDSNDSKFFHPNGFVRAGEMVEYVDDALETLLQPAGLVGSPLRGDTERRPTELPALLVAADGRA
jgi:hypothetical protein